MVESEQAFAKIIVTPTGEEATLGFTMLEADYRNLALGLSGHDRGQRRRARQQRDLRRRQDGRGGVHHRPGSRKRSGTGYFLFCGYQMYSSEGLTLPWARREETRLPVTLRMLADATRPVGDQPSSWRTSPPTRPEPWPRTRSGIPAATGSVLTLAAATAGASADKYRNSGKEVAVVDNASGGAVTVTRLARRACDQGTLHDNVISVAAGAREFLPPVSPAIFNDNNGFARHHVQRRRDGDRRGPQPLLTPHAGTPASRHPPEAPGWLSGGLGVSGSLRQRAAEPASEGRHSPTMADAYPDVRQWTFPARPRANVTPRTYEQRELTIDGEMQLFSLLSRTVVRLRATGFEFERLGEVFVNPEGDTPEEAAAAKGTIRWDTAAVLIGQAAEVAPGAIAQLAALLLGIFPVDHQGVRNPGFADEVGFLREHIKMADVMEMLETAAEQNDVRRLTAPFAKARGLWSRYTMPAGPSPSHSTS